MRVKLTLILFVFITSSTIAQWNPNNQTTGNIYYNGGNVGIGTDVPNSQLHLTSNADHAFKISRSNGMYGFRIFRNAQQGIILFQNTDDSNNPGTRIRLDEGGGGWKNVLINPDGGNVGIGILEPSQKLDIGGRLKIRSDGYASAGVWFTGSDGVQHAFVGQTDLVGTSPIGFFHSGAWRLLVNNNGDVGIGTINPSQKLDIGGRLKIRSDGYASAGVWFTGSDGTQHAFVGQTDLVGTSPIGFFHSGDWRLLVNSNGYVGIGTTNPTQKLTVNGTVYSTEVKVDVNAGTGPDYVFEPTYQLPSLTEIENYIKANKHLPEVPSAKEMETNGINLSEMNMLLLKKVEELTLHLIEANKKIEYLTKRIDEKN